MKRGMAKPGPHTACADYRTRVRTGVCGLLLAALVAAVVLAYRPAWHGGFIWDDNRHVTSPELRFGTACTASGSRGATQQYYPLVHSVFWVEHKLWGDARWATTW